MGYNSGVFLEKKNWRDLLVFGALGLEIAFDVCIGAVAGYYLDRRFNTQPWLLLLFMCFGIAAAAKAVWRDARKYQKRLKEQQKDEKKDGGPLKP